MDFISCGHNSGAEAGGGTGNEQSRDGGGGAAVKTAPNGRKRARAHTKPTPSNASFKESFRPKDGMDLKAKGEATEPEQASPPLSFETFRRTWGIKRFSLVHSTWERSCEVESKNRSGAKYFDTVRCLQEAFGVVVTMLVDPPKKIVRFLRGQVLPGQIGALYALWCLYESQPHCPRVPIRVDPSAMVELLQLKRRLKQAKHVSAARQALALLKRFLSDGRLMPTVSHSPPPRGHAELAYLWDENLQRRDKHYEKQLDRSAWHRVQQQRKYLRKTFVSDGEEGTTTDGDEYLSSLGRNAIRLEEYSAATCFKPDDFDNRLEELRMKAPLISPTDAIKFILEHFRSPETVDAYSRAYSPPSELLLKEDNAGTVIKSHHNLQLVLNDLELLEQQCLQKIIPVDPYGLEQYSDGARAVVELPKPVPFWPPLSAPVSPVQQEDLSPSVQYYGQLLQQQQELQPPGGGVGENKEEPRGKVTFGSVATRLHLKRLHESSGAATDSTSLFPLSMDDHVASPPPNDAQLPSTSFPEIEGAATAGQGSNSKGNILAKKKKPSSSWSAGNILARPRTNM